MFAQGVAASKKKKQDEQETKKPVWADSTTHSIALDSGCDYTGLSTMGLAQIKPHLVGQLIYTAPVANDAISHDEGQSSHGTCRCQPSLEFCLCSAQLPADTRFLSRCHEVKTRSRMIMCLSGKEMKMPNADCLSAR